MAESRRLQLQAILKGIVGAENKVYFQPPNNLKLTFPCIVYEIGFGETEFADNAPYRHVPRYKVTVIDPDPDGDIKEKVVMLPMCSFDRHMVVDNLNHDIYNIFF